MSPVRVLVFGEFFVRFCFWGFQSILILFLVSSAHFSLQSSYKIQGLLMALSFIFCIPGGVIADRLIGFRRALILGVLMMIIGSIFLGSSERDLLYPGLFLLSAGNGFFVPNCASLLGSLRDFTLFYMGTNLGALLGPLVFGVLSSVLGLRVGFFVNAILLGAWCSIFFFMNFNNSNNKPTEKLENSSSSMLMLFLLMLSCVLFFAGVFQIFNSFVIFSKLYVNTAVMGYHISPGTFASLEPFFVVLLAPILAFFSLNYKTSILNTFARLAIGFFLGGVSFIIFTLAALSVAIHGQQVSMLWLILGNFFLGAGEVCFMPSALSAIVKYAPAKIKGSLTGLFYFSFAFAGYFASLLAEMTESHLVNIASGALKFYKIFENTGLFFFSISFFIALFLLLLKMKNTSPRYSIQN